MEFKSVIEAKNLYKKFGAFELNIEQLRIPEGFSTALIGENGAGKTTLINLLAGIRLDAKGTIRWFDETDDIDNGGIRERIGYTGTGNYYIPGWTVRQVKQISELLFPTFDGARFDEWCERLAIDTGGFAKTSKKIAKLSDGNRMKLMLAGVLSRDTDLLLLDEPASPLDPLMRDTLNDMLRRYLASGEENETGLPDSADSLFSGLSKDRPKTVFFSTHNIQDMESVTDYAIILEDGKVVEEGFVEDLKEKYVLVKGDSESAEAAKKVLYSFLNAGSFGYEGICLSSELDKLAGLNVSREVPTLFQISVAVMKKNTKLRV